VKQKFVASSRTPRNRIRVSLRRRSDDDMKEEIEVEDMYIKYA